MPRRLHQFTVCWLPAFSCNLLVRFGGFDGPEMKGAHALVMTIAKFTYVLIPFLHHKMLTNGCSQQWENTCRCRSPRISNVRVPHADVARARGSEIDKPRELPGILI